MKNYLKNKTFIVAIFISVILSGYHFIYSWGIIPLKTSGQWQMAWLAFEELDRHLYWIWYALVKTDCPNFIIHIEIFLGNFLDSPFDDIIYWIFPAFLFGIIGPLTYGAVPIVLYFLTKKICFIIKPLFTKLKS